MPEKMNIKAANKFLKVLEEPPNKTILLLVSEDKGSIINTILSRLQHTRTPNYTVNDTIENSKTQKTESFLNFCRLSNGNMGKVWSYTEETLQVPYFEEFKVLNRLCFKNNFSDHNINLLTIDEKRFLENFAKFVHQENSTSIISLFESAIKKIKRNANSKIIFFQLALDLSDLLKLKSKFVIQ